MDEQTLRDEDIRTELREGASWIEAEMDDVDTTDVDADDADVDADDADPDADSQDPS